MYIILYILPILPAMVLFRWWRLWKKDFSGRTRTKFVNPPKRRGYGHNETTDNHSENDVHQHGIFDMDIIYIGCFDFVLYFLLIVPSHVYLFGREFILLNTRRFVNSHVVSLRGSRFMKKWEPEVVCARMLLKTSEMIGGEKRPRLVVILLGEKHWQKRHGC